MELSVGETLSGAEEMLSTGAVFLKTGLTKGFFFTVEIADLLA